jgi:hypothetical protein
MRGRHKGVRTETQGVRDGATHMDNTHTHTHTHTQNTRTCTALTRFVVEGEIVGNGRFRGCLLVSEDSEREAIVRTVKYEAGRRSLGHRGPNLYP